MADYTSLLDLSILQLSENKVIAHIYYSSRLMRASVTFWEATAPVKLPLIGCLQKELSKNKIIGWYFNFVF